MLELDANATFVPNYMRVWFKRNKLVAASETYLEDCKYDVHGYFGNLEITVVRPCPRW